MTNPCIYTHIYIQYIQTYTLTTCTHTYILYSLYMVYVAVCVLYKQGCHFVMNSGGNIRARKKTAFFKTFFNKYYRR